MATPKALIRLLHLEDNPRAAQLVRDRLEADHMSCEIMHVKTRSQFDSAIAKRSFDMVLCDSNIPECDGVAAMKRARQAQPNLPVIFLSGAMGDSGAAECRNVPASDLVMKYRLENLAPAMRRFLRTAAERPKKQVVVDVSVRKRRTSPISLPTAAAA